jgi:hypothetical protein
MLFLLKGLTHFGETFVQAIYCLQSSRIRERKHIRSYSHDVAILPMQFYKCPFAPLADVVEEAPPVCVCGKPWPWISVDSIAVLVTNEVRNCQAGNDNVCIMIDEG